jgi:formylglycine-generating enzyme
MFIRAAFFIFTVAFALNSLILFGQEKQKDVSTENVLGISKTKPDSGPFVEVDGVFMVPYTTKVPGSTVEFEMIPIPGGKFLFGSPEDEEDRRADEGPQVEVAIKPFWMGKHEVTWGEYYLFMKLDRIFKEFNDKNVRPVSDSNKVDAVTAPSSLYDPSFTFEAGDKPNQPCATVTQFAAKQYTKYLSRLTGSEFYRLPTEAEWEYACRAGTTTRFYFGDDADELEEHAWYVDNSDDERHPVGKKKPNPWGLHDMYGNVAEWTLDSYNEKGYAHLAGQKEIDGSQILTTSEKVFPRVLRGGSWELEVEDCRSAARMASNDPEWKAADPNLPRSPWWYTDSPSLGAGFRIIRPYHAPNDRAEQEKWWDADVQDIRDDYENRIRDNGRGALGIVDPELPKVIEEKIK